MAKSKYTDEFKKEVAAATSEPGATLKAVGEQFGVNPTLVRNWKLQFSDNSTPDREDMVMLDFDDLVDSIVEEFKKDPRNKVFAHQSLLIASVKEETDNEISQDQLGSLIQSYENGELDGDEEELYDAAVYCCSVLARKCFGEDPDDEDEEVDYEVSWVENEDGTFSAEIRPN